MKLTEAEALDALLSRVGWDSDEQRDAVRAALLGEEDQADDGHAHEGADVDHDRPAGTDTAGLDDSDELAELRAELARERSRNRSLQGQVDAFNRNTITDQTALPGDPHRES